MRISFNPLAERELNDAAQYYDLESPGLGEAFLAEVERSCHAVAESLTAQLNRWAAIGMSRANVTRSKAVPQRPRKTQKIWRCSKSAPGVVKRNRLRTISRESLGDSIETDWRRE